MSKPSTPEDEQYILAEKIGDYCHTKYLGCSLENKVTGTWNYGYTNEAVNMVHEYFDTKEGRQALHQYAAKAQEDVLDVVAKEEAWEQSRDHIAVKFGLPLKYDHAKGKCVCAGTIYEEQKRIKQLKEGM